MHGRILRRACGRAPAPRRTRLACARGAHRARSACRTIRTFYPPLDDAADPLLEPNTTYRARLEPGEQANLRVQPASDDTFTFQTIGRADTVMVLFDASAAPPAQVAADDDSGVDRNAQFSVALRAGTEYVLRVRLYYSDDAASFGVQYF